MNTFEIGPEKIYNLFVAFVSKKAFIRYLLELLYLYRQYDDKKPIDSCLSDLKIIN